MRAGYETRNLKIELGTISKVHGAERRAYMQPLNSEPKNGSAV